MTTTPPLCVDLDGTLVNSNLLIESFLLLIKKNPFYIFSSFFWLLKGGKALLKQEIARRVQINPSLLPYTQHFLSYLNAEKAKGRYLVLATATNNQIANQIANHLGIFSEVIASDGEINLKGIHKREALNQRFGAKQYDYAGNAHDDLEIWRSSRIAIIVNPSSSLVTQANKVATIEQVFAKKNIHFKDISHLFRFHQYVKNLLVFVPLVVGHYYTNLTSSMHSLLAFLIFCCLASSAYLMNDLVDLEYDRQDESKCTRPFTSGNISLSIGLIGFPLLFIIGLALSFFLPPAFSLCIITYYLFTLLYSFYFKQMLLVDVFALSFFYTLRIIGGIIAINADFSPWLISYSTFLFLSLAFVKRYSELKSIEHKNKMQIAGRNYLVSDLPQIQLFGIVSGYLSVLVLALYINSYNVVVFYRFPQLLWLICLIALYWISRIWLLAARDKINGDPIMFALKDKISWLFLFLVLTIIVISAV